MSDTTRGISRRRALLLGVLAAAGRPALLAGPPFWDKKPASQWTPDEVNEMITHSPWAKQVTAQYRVAMDDSRIQPGAPPVQRPGEPMPGECGLAPCSSVMPGKVMVIWESAQPIREVLHPEEPPEFNGRYIISIRGLAGDYAAGRLRAGSELKAKDRPPLQPGIVDRRNNTWLFGFSRELLPLTKKDRDVQFTVRIGENLSDTLVRASFDPREMIYRGELAV
ncbi:MAG TPA: hypothetical protein VFT60_00815 [Bryobacteraceae bacterium]|nr:hypothetical protein [Bryobacteraceae bacterium]